MRPSPVPLNLLRNDAFCPHKLHDSTVGISPSAPMAARHRVIGDSGWQCSAARHAVGLAAILKHLLGTKGAGVCSRPKGA